MCVCVCVCVMRERNLDFEQLKIIIFSHCPRSLLLVFVCIGKKEEERGEGSMLTAKTERMAR
jgi:hypothetical protein